MDLRERLLASRLRPLWPPRRRWVTVMSLDRWPRVPDKTRREVKSGRNRVMCGSTSSTSQRIVQFKMQKSMTARLWDPREPQNRWRLPFSGRLSRPRVRRSSLYGLKCAQKRPPLAARFHRRSKTKQVRGDSTALNEDVAVFRSRAPHPRRLSLDAPRQSSARISQAESSRSRQADKRRPIVSIQPLYHR